MHLTIKFYCMKKTLALATLCAGLFMVSFAAPTPASTSTKKNFVTENKQFDCTMTATCGGVTVSATGATCQEAGSKLGAACDKLEAIE